MSDVLIKNMKIPKNCTECRFSVDGWCYVLRPESEEERQRITTNYCSLIEIPPHGRLIDADKLIRNFQAMADDEWNKNCGATWSDGFLEAINMTEDAPTVIEAEDGE